MPPLRLRRFLYLDAACLLATSLGAAPRALAASQTSQSGNVTASFTFHGKFPTYSNETLTIAQAGTVLYDEPVVSKFCNGTCAPGSTAAGHSVLHVLDLEQDGQPDVVLDLYSGGAHCCSIEQVFSFDPGTMTYVMTEHNFGDPGERLVDLGRNGRYEFLTADDWFAYAFTDFAGSGMPIEILTFFDRRFDDVTRNYPKPIAKNAAMWLKLFNGMARDHYPDSVGVIAAWAADEELLGHRMLVRRYLDEPAKAGHLNTALSPIDVGGQRFVAKLKRFLRKHGYMR